MALFLDTHRFNRWIPKLIKFSKEELIIIVPYIKISKTIYQALKHANDRGVQIVLIYRENGMNAAQKSKLLELSNLSLMHHPHIHAKCYYNGDLLILGSMNLYEYSEKNNREMGSLFSHTELESIFDEDELLEEELNRVEDQEDFFIDARKEMSEVFVSATLEKCSEYYNNKPFELFILLSEYDMCLQFCKELNQYFRNKRFSPKEHNGIEYLPFCQNYYDRVNITYNYNRWEFTLSESEEVIKILFDQWKNSYDAFEIDGFKYYWNYPKGKMFLYKDWKHEKWKRLENQDNTDERKREAINFWMFGINKIIDKYRNLSGR